MVIRILVSVILLFAIVGFSACFPKEKVKVVFKTELHQLFETDFIGFDAPEIMNIKLEGKGKSFPYATYDEVWDSAIIVLMQQWIIVRLSKDAGVIVTANTPPTPPLGVFIEQNDDIIVYIHIMDELYRTVENRDKVTVRFSMQDKERLLDDLYYKIGTQIYSGRKWRYLYEGVPNESNCEGTL